MTAWPRPPRIAAWAVAAVVAFTCAPFAPSPAAAAAAASPPNVVLIVTDDQRWDSLVGMPIVQRTLVAHGVTFREAFVVNPLCCPSRTSILTGRYSHSTGVYRQAPPFGRFDAFDDRSTLATWLDDAGYRTAMIGKYVDGGQSMLLDGYVPPGWDTWFAFVRAAYEDFAISRDGEIVSYGHATGDHSTDVLAEQALAFVREVGDDPFFLLFAPAAPHAPATAAARHADAEPTLAPWPGPAVDEADVADKPAWARALPRLGEDGLAELEAFRLAQARSLLAVDEAVARLVHELRRSGRLRDTLLVFTSDNGIAYGEHRWTKKEVPYEESIRVPMVVRFDRLVSARRHDDHLVLNIDLAPTIAALAGAEAPPADGRSLVPLLTGGRARWRRDFLVEHLEGANPVPTYCAVRSTRHLYVEYRTGERELYDLRSDPSELVNVAEAAAFRPIAERLDGRLEELCDPPPPDVPALRRPPSAASSGATWPALAAVVGSLVLAAGWVAHRRARRPAIGRGRP